MRQVSALPEAQRVALLVWRLGLRGAVAVGEGDVGVQRGGVVGSGSAERTLKQDHTVCSEEVDY